MMDFSSLKVVELRARLKEHGLPIYGVKKDLVERLTIAESLKGVIVERGNEEGEGLDNVSKRRNHNRVGSPEPESQFNLASIPERTTSREYSQHLSPLISLAPELFTEILSHIASPPELAKLCLVSSQMYMRVVPILYRKFTYHGVQHDSKILKRFYLTVLWRDDLARCVEELDIGEWGDCPRLEDYVGGPNGDDDDDEDEDGSEESSGEDEHVGHEDDEPWDSQEESIAPIEEGSIDVDESIDHDQENEDDGVDQDLSNSLEKMREKWRKKRENAERKALMAQPMPPHFKISKTDDEDSDFEPSESGSDSDSLASSPESEIELEVGGYLGPQDKKARYEDVYEALRKEASMLGFSYGDFLADYYKETWDPDGEIDEEQLLCNMLPLLKNVKTMYLMPIEAEYWGSPLRKMVAKSFEDGEKPVLERLGKLCICSSLHIGPKGHREYEMELDHFLPYMLLPKLHTLALLTPTTPFKCGDDLDPDFSPYTNKSNITSLVLDESELEPRDTFALLAAPKALTYLRWSQDLSCQSSWIGCHAPFHKHIVAALIKHKASLAELDLDLRHTYCRTRGHAANPATTDEGLREMYGQDTRLRVAERDGLLIGSLKEFSALKTLSIDVAALCGHQNWVESPMPMVELLPPNLHALTLRVNVKPGREVATGFENEVWMDQAFDLLERKDRFVPGLKVLNVRVSRKVDRWDGEKKWWVENEEAEKGLLWRELERRCGIAGVDFDVRNEEWGTKISYFVEKSEARDPGRDW